MMWRSLAVAVVVVVATVESILMGVDATDDVDISGANMVRGAAHPPSPGSPTSPTHSLALWW
jgi:hypothetical protein